MTSSKALFPSITKRLCLGMPRKHIDARIEQKVRDKWMRTRNGCLQNYGCAIGAMKNGTPVRFNVMSCLSLKPTSEENPA